MDAAGDVFVSDSNNQCVRMGSAGTGIITTVLGTTIGYSDDGGASNHAKVHNPEGLFFDTAGNLYLADSYNGVVTHQ